MMFLVRCSLFLAICLLGAHAFGANEEPRTKNPEQSDAPFRPENGKFPPLEKAASYRGELVFVDHATRRGSLRVEFKSEFFRSPPTPFALLPYGMVRYHGAPADLRDIPLGTVLNIRAFLPPDSKNSSVVTSPNHWYPLPLENHAMLIEDEPSLCLREGKTWKLKEVDMKNDQGLVIATYESKEAAEAKAPEQKLTLDATTRFWRGRESLKLADLIAEGTWPASGKKSLGGQSVLLGLNWKPCPDGIFVRYHISDVWLDDKATQRAIQDQTEVHKALIRSRWMPAFVDNVEYGKFGRATVTVTLFGGMDPSLYADFKKGGLEAHQRLLWPGAYGVQRLHPGSHQGAGSGPTGEQRNPSRNGNGSHHRRHSSRTSGPHSRSSMAERLYSPRGVH